MNRKRSECNRWMHKCPKCGKWSQFLWPRLDFATLKMECPYCDEFFSRIEWEKGGGRWIAKNPKHPAKDFHVNALDDSQLSWEKLIEEWVEAQLLAKKGNYSKLIRFIETVLVEEWEICSEVSIKIPISVSKTLKQKIEELAIKERRSMNDQIIVLLETAMGERA